MPKYVSDQIVLINCENGLFPDNMWPAYINEIKNGKYGNIFYIYRAINSQEYLGAIYSNKATDSLTPRFTFNIDEKDIIDIVPDGEYTCFYLADNDKLVRCTHEAKCKVEGGFITKQYVENVGWVRPTFNIEYDVICVGEVRNNMKKSALSIKPGNLELEEDLYKDTKDYQLYRITTPKHTTWFVDGYGVAQYHENFNQSYIVAENIDDKYNLDNYLVLDEDDTCYSFKRLTTSGTAIGYVIKADSDEIIAKEEKIAVENGILDNSQLVLGYDIFVIQDFIPAKKQQTISMNKGTLSLEESINQFQVGQVCKVSFNPNIKFDPADIDGEDLSAIGITGLVQALDLGKSKKELRIIVENVVDYTDNFMLALDDKYFVFEPIHTDGYVYGNITTESSITHDVKCKMHNGIVNDIPTYGKDSLFVPTLIKKANFKVAQKIAITKGSLDLEEKLFI